MQIVVTIFFGENLSVKIIWATSR